MKVAVAILIALALGFAAFVRLSPMEAVRWHVDPQTAPGPGPDGSFRVTVGLDRQPKAVLEALDAIAMATPRTTRLAGTVADGRITYVTRTAFWGFPDATTVEARASGTGSELTIFARLRFGRGDMGVNRKRVQAWIAAMGAS